MATQALRRFRRAAEFAPGTPLLEVRDLSVEFATRYGTVQAVDRVSFGVAPGETLAVLGESGCGKSVTAQAVLGILDQPPGRVRGSVRYRGTELLGMDERRLRHIRAEQIAMIFQDALSALNPVFTVGFQIAETLRVHRGLSRSASRARAVELLDLVRIPDARNRVRAYPHEFSGGMRQRVMIAMAVALDPALLIADEPTTALDVTVQAQIIDLLGQLQADRNTGLILITHDMGVVADVADRIAVMYAGRIVEEAPAADVYAAPKHPYTRALLRSVPDPARPTAELEAIPGQPPDLTKVPPGCPFVPRCPIARPRCSAERPPLLPAGPGRSSACHYPEEVGRP